MNPRCACPETSHDCRRVVLTGGPGAGKTAVLEIVRRHFCEHVAILPEAAGIIYSGGFPRQSSGPARCAAQRSIYHVQRELERMVEEEHQAAIALCDRGTVDGLAYWPGTPEQFWSDVGTTLDAEIRRYAAVIHLRTPSVGYNHRNPLRIESLSQAAEIDAKIALAWSSHPHRFFIESTPDFLTKARHALALLQKEIPPCCELHGPN